MNQQLLCTRVLPSREYFPWYKKVKRKLNDIQQRCDELLHKIRPENCSASERKDECFILCGQRTSRSSTAINDSIEKELVPNDERDEIKIQYFAIDVPMQDLNVEDIFVIPYQQALNLLSSDAYSMILQAIVVANDTNEYEGAKNIFEDFQNVKLTHLKDLREMASLTLEETMFKPMKCNAENLVQQFQQTIYRKDRTSTDGQFITMKRKTRKQGNELTAESCINERHRKGNKKKVWKRNNKGIKPRMAEGDRQSNRLNSYKTRTNGCSSQVSLRSRQNKDMKISEQRRKNLEDDRKSYRLTRTNGCSSQVSLTGLNKDGKVSEKRRESLELANNVHLSKDAVEGLYNEIMGMFNRSRIPEQNKPKFSFGISPKVGDQVSAELYRIDPSVKSCGYRYSTLQVFVDDTSNEKINKSIKNVLEHHGVGDFKIVPSIGTYKHFLGVGAKVNPKEDRYGSVGGFAERNSNTLCALISGHVAIHSEDNEVVLSDSKTSIRSNLIKETVPVGQAEAVLDISATVISSTDAGMCETKFKSEEGVPVTAMECTYEEKTLDKRPVHLWGATSTPGLGIITMPEIRDRFRDKTFIVVEDRVGSANHLCKEGDSGAMVCADNDYDSSVECISMLIGEDNETPGKYATFRIDKGIQQLERQTNSNFELLKK